MKTLVDFKAPGVPDFADPELKKYLQGYDGAFAEYTRDLEIKLARMINEKHATLLIPRVSVDIAHTAVAINSAGWSALALPNIASEAAGTLTTVLNYVGRGVLQKLVIAEIDSGGAGAFTCELIVTIDGNVLVSSSALLSAQSTARTVVGSQGWVSATDIHVHDDSIGLPFNESCKIEFRRITAANTGRIGWKVAKKL